MVEDIDDVRRDDITGEDYTIRYDSMLVHAGLLNRGQRLTYALKHLENRGLLEIQVDERGEPEFNVYSAIVKQRDSPIGRA